MKIAFLLLTVDHLAGTERAVVSQANQLCDRHEVEIVSVLRQAPHPKLAVDHRVTLRYLSHAVPDQPVSVPGVELGADADRLPGRPSLLVPPQWDPTLNALCDVALEAHLGSIDADILVTLTPGLLAAACQLAPRDVALVHQEHRSSMHRTAGVEPLLAFAAQADAVVALTEDNEAWLRQQLGPRAPHVVTMPNAAPQHSPRSRLDQPLIMSAGRLVPEKQWEHLIEAFATISDRLPGWRLRIFGEGTSRGRLMNKARKHQLYDRVELPGPTTDMAGEWAKASIGAMTSRKEGFPLVLHEAMAAGVPVVSYDCGTGPSSIIDHEQTGLLVPEGDVAGMASGLFRLAEDVALRRRLGAAGLAACRSYSPERITRAWEALYEEVRHNQRRATRVRRRLLSPGERPDQADSRTLPVVTAPDDLTPADARRDGLSVLVQVARDSADDWFVLPGQDPDPPTLVIPLERRRNFLEDLASAAVPGHLVIQVSEEDYWMARVGPASSMTEWLLGNMAGSFLLGPDPGPPSQPTHLCEGADVRVEFWSSRPGEGLATRNNNHLATRVSTRERVDADVLGVPVRSLPLQGPYVNELQFPIDAVYTWVDDSDPEWQAARAARLGEVPDELAIREASGAARFRNRDELRYSMRSLHMFAPWLRKIFLVTANQRPAWLVDHPRVEVVHHEDILPAESLPTFNSHAIETALHRVPGLSEHFIYFNDDVFLGRPTVPTQYFTPGGLVATFPAPWPVGLDDQDHRPYLRAAYNNRRLIRDRFGVTLTTSYAHVPHAHRRQVLDQVASEFGTAVDSTARTPFRSASDVSVASSLAQTYGLLTGCAFESKADSRFVDLSAPGVRGKFARLRDRSAESFCLGDHHDFAQPPAQVDLLVDEFLEMYFPVPAPWERQAET